MARQGGRKGGAGRRHRPGDKQTKADIVPGAADRLRSRYRLTGAEAALAAALADGSRLSEYAGKRGVSMSTVRTQLKQCFRKTATSRQADLIRLILIGAPAGR